MPKIAKVILIGVVGLLMVIALIGGAFYFLFSDIYFTTNPNSWETYTHTSYSMTMPKGMKDNDDITLDNQYYTLMDCKSNRHVVIAVASYVMDKDERKISQRLDMYNLITQLTPAHVINGVKVEPQKRGDMIYWEYTQSVSGTSFQVVEASFLSETTIYDVNILCRQDDYEKFHDYIFQWLDSFTPLY